MINECQDILFYCFLSVGIVGRKAKFSLEWKLS